MIESHLRQETIQCTGSLNDIFQEGGELAKTPLKGFLNAVNIWDSILKLFHEL